MKCLYLFILPAILFQQIIYSQWVQTNGLHGGLVQEFATSDANFFAGTDSVGVFLSTNDGESWTVTGLTDKWVGALAVIGNNIFVGTWWGEGVFLSTDNGTTWTNVNTGLTDRGKIIEAFAVTGNNLFAGTWDGVFLSTNNGTNWSAVKTGLSASYINCFAISGTSLFAGTGFWSGGRVFLTSNNGINWSEVGSFGFPSFPNVTTSLAISNGNLYAATSYGVFLSTNEGATWSAVSEGLPQHLYDTTRYMDIQCLVFSGQNLFAAIDGGGVFFSTNGGVRWIPVNEGLTNMRVLTLAVRGANLFAGTESGVWKRPLLEIVPVELTLFTATTNSKEVTLNWSTATELNNQGFEVQRKFGSNDFVTIGSVKGNGTTTSPNNYTYVDKLFDAGKYFYRLKQIDFEGTFEYSNEIEVEVRILDKFTLEQNYPNPFNPTTIIKYSIPTESPLLGGARGGFVTLKIYDILGNEIATLVNEEKPAGTYEVAWSAAGLPSGVYFYKLKAGSYVETKKMILQR